jgi:hypothetical protein
MTNHNDWNQETKVAFRFSFIFILSFIFIKNNGTFPIFFMLTKPLLVLVQQLTPWFAEHILHYKYDYSIYTNGSGDTSYDWVSVLILLLIAVLGTLIWSILDRKRPSYNVAYYWLTTAIRYYVAFMLINYGVIKLVHGQMSPPGIGRLMQPLGELSPMSLAWTFFGYSKGYNIFIGIAEILASLLLFRKTMVLGALITVAVGLNIMATNYFFDVPVKMVSTALVVLAIFLLLPHIKPLFGLFVLGKPAQLRTIAKPKFRKPWKNWAMFLAKGLFIALMLLQHAFILFSNSKSPNYHSPLYGIYLIEKESIQPTAIPKEWTWIIFEYEGSATVRDNLYKKKNETIAIYNDKKQITLNYSF